MLSTFCLERHGVILRCVYGCLTSPVETWLEDEAGTGNGNRVSGTENSPAAQESIKWLPLRAGGLIAETDTCAQSTRFSRVANIHHVLSCNTSALQPSRNTHTQCLLY